MEIKGVIKRVEETEQVTDTFKKRTVVIQTIEQYPQTIGIEFVQDKCDVLNGFKPSEDVTIGINIRGREWTNKEGKVMVFNSIQGWFIKRTQEGNNPQGSAVQEYQKPKQQVQPTHAGEGDIPF